MYTLAIFDFDGTLVDSAPGIIDIMREVASEYQMPAETLHNWMDLIGVPLLTQMETIFPTDTPEFHLEVATRYRQLYDVRAIELCPPFSGLSTTLQQLSEAKVSMAIVSSKRRTLIEPVLSHHSLSHYFTLVVGSQDVLHHKPHPEPVHFVTRTLQEDVRNCVVVGDSTFDIEMANNAGASGIAVTTGVHTREVLSRSQPAHIVDELSEVVPLILNGRMQRQSA